MNSITILKLGGSLITDKSKPYTPRVDIINNLALQIRSAVKADSNLSLIIGNGGGSFPHYPAHFYKMKQGISTKRQIMGYAKVQDAAARLNRIIVKALLEAGVEAVSLQPSSMIIAREGRVAKFFVDPFIELLKKNIVPVFYGDIVMDTKRGSTIFSTEQLIVELASRLRTKKFIVKKIIQNGTTQGVLDKKNRVISQIDTHNLDAVKKVIHKTEGFDVTGGMWHKIEESMHLARRGVPTLIINGALDKKILQEAILGCKVKGTYISA